MKRATKIFILGVALVLPALTYVFLREYGDNRFAIPVYYEDGLLMEGCAKVERSTHLVVFETYPLNGIRLFYFPQWVNEEEFYRQCSRIQEKWPSVYFTAIADSSIVNKMGNLLLVDNELQLYEMANCYLSMGQGKSINSPVFNQLVLVDETKRIRGYYNGHELKDMDRLDVELDILSSEVRKK